jgi:aryl-alcohol dehydrogenase-like predicted oxidoreductase
VFPTGATRLGENPTRGQEAWEARNSNPHTWQVIDAVAKVAEDRGVSQSQVSLAWLAAQPAVTSVLLGARSVEQLTDNLGAADLVLTAEELDTLSEASIPPAEPYPYGEAGSNQRNRNISGGR